MPVGIAYDHRSSNAHINKKGCISFPDSRALYS